VHRSPPLQGCRVRSHGTRGGTGALRIRNARSGATGHVAAPKPTLAGRQGPVLHGMWQRMDARTAPCLELKLIHRGIRSAGYRQWLSGPPRERLQTRKWGQLFSVLLGYLEFFCLAVISPSSARTRNFSLKKRPAHSAPLGGVDRRSRNDYHLIAGRRWWAPGRR
jgi:hypothetical protein